jgi:hypothetical protein
VTGSQGSVGAPQPRCGCRPGGVWLQGRCVCAACGVCRHLTGCCCCCYCCCCMPWWWRQTHMNAGPLAARDLLSIHLWLWAKCGQGARACGVKGGVMWVVKEGLWVSNTCPLCTAWLHVGCCLMLLLPRSGYIGSGCIACLAVAVLAYVMMLCWSAVSRVIVRVVSAARWVMPAPLLGRQGQQWPWCLAARRRCCWWQFATVLTGRVGVGGQGWVCCL